MQFAVKSKAQVFSLVLVCFVWSVGCAVAPARGDESAGLGREIADRVGDSVVTVRVVAKMRVAMEGREMSEEESTDEVTATVIDPSGVAVCSLSETDPSHMMAMMMDDPDMKWEAEITDLKMRLADGQEIQAEIVLRDKDLDLAFVRPVERPAAPLPAVDLAASTQPELLEEILVLSRLGEVANRSLAAYLDRILAVVRRPRTLYVPGPAAMSGGLGRPVFTLDGKAVGILVMRSMPGAAGSGHGGRPMMLPVIVPAADVLETAKQIPS
jgi:hypothetical protein